MSVGAEPTQFYIQFFTEETWDYFKRNHDGNVYSPKPTQPQGGIVLMFKKSDKTGAQVFDFRFEIVLQPVRDPHDSTKDFFARDVGNLPSRRARLMHMCLNLSLIHI